MKIVKTDAGAKIVTMTSEVKFVVINVVNCNYALFLNCNMIINIIVYNDK